MFLFCGILCLYLGTVASVHPQMARDWASNGEALPMEAFRATILFVALDCVCGFAPIVDNALHLHPTSCEYALHDRDAGRAQSQHQPPANEMAHKRFSARTCKSKEKHDQVPDETREGLSSLAGVAMLHCAARR